MNGTGWPDRDCIEMLLRRARGQSAAGIAVTIGASRSAVCGLLHRIYLAGAHVDPGAYDDAALLAMLDALFGRGEAAEAIGRRMGLPRFAVLHLAVRLQVEAAAAEGGLDPGRGCQDGTMPLGWWAKGFALRGAAA